MSSQPLHVRGAGKRWRGKPKRPLPPAAPVEASPLDPSCIVAREEGPGAGLVYRTDLRPLCASAGPTDASAGEATPPTYVGLRVQPSLMWGWGRGNGFCGETCLQQALLWHGNYVSAERIRYAAGNNELLVGVHDKKAAKALRLAYDSFDSESIPEPQHDAFAGWAAWHVGLGHHVTAGWYTFTDAGDDEYDHIMPIVGVRARSVSTGPEGAGERPVEAPAVLRKGGKAPPRESLLEAGATVTALDFLDLAQDKVRRVQRGLHGPDGTLFASRAEASARNAAECGAVYPPADATGYVYALPTDTLYGIAITGNAGPPSERLCLSLRPAGDCPVGAGFAAAGLWREPDWGAEDGLDEAPVPLAVSGLATGLRPGAPYALLRFDDPAAVPEKAGGKGLDAGRKWRRKWTFTAPAESVELRAFDTVPSDGACYYRLVPAPPPPSSSS